MAEAPLAGLASTARTLREYIWGMTSEADGSAATRRLELVTGLPDELHVALADGDRALNADGELRASRPSFERACKLAELAGDVQAMALAALAPR